MPRGQHDYIATVALRMKRKSLTYHNKNTDIDLTIMYTTSRIDSFSVVKKKAKTKTLNQGIHSKATIVEIG
ncbi:Hypothetical predicted protein [Octopus vulgaris]|uniref:Uncharacterized protein n=1 Tax=Octopus vulgaris TaxID=6645 RepID=A0AA36AQW5_OCTVU|nr:Hypothetical predicted protein [Octopus vulgaris]